MPNETAIDSGHKTIISFATTGFDAEVTSLSISGAEKGIHPVPHMGSTGQIPKIFSDLPSPGSVSVEIYLDCSQQAFNNADGVGDTTNTPIAGLTDTMTITFPNNSTLIGSGWVAGYEPSVVVNETMTASFEFMFDGVTPPAITPA